MAKFFGKVGYELLTETSPGIWTPTTTYREYYGDVIRNMRRWSEGTSINDNLTLTNEISILGDPFAFENFSSMKWVEYLGQKWKVNDVDIAYPRLTLRFGGVYNDDVDATEAAQPID